MSSAQWWGRSPTDALLGLDLDDVLLGGSECEIVTMPSTRYSYLAVDAAMRMWAGRERKFSPHGHEEPEEIESGEVMMLRLKAANHASFGDRCDCDFTRRNRRVRRRQDSECDALDHGLRRIRQTVARRDDPWWAFCLAWSLVGAAMGAWL